MSEKKINPEDEMTNSAELSQEDLDQVAGGTINSATGDAIKYIKY
jgi:hypothetical protein